MPRRRPPRAVVHPSFPPRKRTPSAQPPPPAEPVMKTYKVIGDYIVHGKKKGDRLKLPDTGATRALVQAGHLVEVADTKKDQAVKSADKTKEADNG
jgi:hypothetical protein